MSIKIIIINIIVIIIIIIKIIIITKTTFRSWRLSCVGHPQLSSRTYFAKIINKKKLIAEIIVNIIKNEFNILKNCIL